MSRAGHDLDGIYNYIVHKILEPETALNLVSDYYGAAGGSKPSGIIMVSWIENARPYRCPEHKQGIYANCGYRQFFVENDTVIFRINEVKKTVIVVTVRYPPSEF